MRDFAKYFKAITVVVKMSRLTGPVTSNLTDDMNIKQGHKDFFYESKFCFLFFNLPAPFHSLHRSLHLFEHMALEPELGNTLSPSCLSHFLTPLSQPRPVPPETTANEGLALTNQISTTWGQSLEGDTLISERVPPAAMTVKAKQELWSDPLKFTRKSLKCLTA